ncbi:NAD(P)-binding domain-containing protein [Thermoleophilia bacterium SCSIO 60948]|nr:NAD(P)-binding domain-containing protein [Thermoleophilia bacterium SCSIO 60948]
MVIGFAGSGNMAAAMARGWASAPEGAPAMLFSDNGSGRAARLAAELGGEARGSLDQLAADSDFVVLAVKPHGLEAAAEAMRGHANGICSVLGATSVESLRAAFPDTPVTRCMPTIASELRTGVICHAPLDPADGALGETMLAALGMIGRTIEVADPDLDVATAMMGNTPAYFALFAEALADAGAAEGLDGRLALELVRESMAATARLLERLDPATLREQVASPGGSTEGGLAALEADELRAVAAHAVRGSLERMGR